MALDTQSAGALTGNPTPTSAKNGVRVKALRGVYWPAGNPRSAGEEFDVADPKDARQLVAWGKVEILP
jgi:hypothetical protein